MELAAQFIYLVVFMFVLYIWHADRRNAQQERQDLLNRSNAQSKDLMDRIMAKTYDDFKVGQAMEQTEVTPPDPDIIDIEDAKDEIGA